MEEVERKITKYLEPQTSKSKSLTTRRKNELVKAIEAWGETVGAEQGRKTLIEKYASYEKLDWLISRLKPGFTLEGNKCFGWYSEDQIIAEELPLLISEGKFGLDNYFRYIEVHADNSLFGQWAARGFWPAQPLPLRFSLSGGSAGVKVDWDKTEYWIGFGYANAWPLPYEQLEDKVLGFYWQVTQNVPEFGWGRPWKWWQGCRGWYLEKHPHLFIHCDWWPQQTDSEEPQPEPWAAVLGGAEGEALRQGFGR